MLVGGCETFAPPVAVRPLLDGQTAAIDMTSNRRATYVLFADPDGPEKPGQPRALVVAEPPPDTALQSTFGVVASLKAPEGADASIDADVAQTIVKLAERTQAVIILRDSLFRLAEARANGFVTDENWFQGFQKVVDASQLIALGSAGSPSAAVLAALQYAEGLDKRAAEASLASMQAELQRLRDEHKALTAASTKTEEQTKRIAELEARQQILQKELDERNASEHGRPLSELAFDAAAFELKTSLDVYRSLLASTQEERVKQAFQQRIEALEAVLKSLEARKANPVPSSQPGDPRPARSH